MTASTANNLSTTCHVLFSTIQDGRRRKQMGQSPYWGGGSLNNALSCNSATILSHCFLCFDLCFFFHAALQYFTAVHLLQMVRLLPSFPQLAHSDMSSVGIVMFCFMCCASNIDWCLLCRWIFYIKSKNTTKLTIKITIYNHIHDGDRCIGLLLCREKNLPSNHNNIRLILPALK